MIQFKKLAIAGAVSAAMLTATAAQAHVAYNTEASNKNTVTAGDGLHTPTWDDGSSDYAGNLPANWIVNVHNMHGHNNSYDVNTADAGFNIQSHNNKWNPSASWGAALGYGLIDMEAAGDLYITIAADTGSTLTPAFTLFSGWDDHTAGTDTSSKHQAWNNTGNVAAPNTLGSDELAYIGHSASTTSGGSTTLALTNLASGMYTLFIGGNGSGSTSGLNQLYTANISTSPVPVPAAAWLMGSGILGLAGMRRKKAQA